MKKRGYLGILIVLLITFVMSTDFVESKRLVFSNELAQTQSDGKFVIDVQDYENEIELKFANNLDASIIFNRLADTFVFNRDIDLSGNEIKNVRLEQLAIAPTCDVSSEGRIYFNTTDSNTYVCMSLNWIRLDREGEGLEINSTEQTTDYNTLVENTINILSSTSTNRPTDHQYIVKTLGNSDLKTQVATRTTGNSQRYYRYLQSLVWSDWRQIKTKKYGGYSLEEIDQTDGTVSYIGRQRDSDNKWLITKSDASGFSYAQEENNLAITDYSTAWTNRLTLVYGVSFAP